MKITEIKPTASASQTGGQVSSQGITYNEAGLAYNAAGYTYGGFYGDSDTRPINAYASTRPAIGRATPTSAGITSDPYTYNEAGYTYNQVGVVYGGLYGAQDTKPLISLARLIRPSLTRIDEVPRVLDPDNILQDQTGAFLADQLGALLFDQT